MGLTIESFITRIEEEFSDIAPNTLKPDEEFRKTFEWNSMNALVLMALITTEFDINITAEELRNCNTIREVYNIVVSKEVA